MKQLIMQNDRAIVSRVPRVALDAGSVLVRTHYSLVSTGTELAGIKSQLAAQEQSSLDKAAGLSSKAMEYLGKAIHDPVKATQRLRQIAANRVRRLSQMASRPATLASSKIVDLGWSSVGDANFEGSGTDLRLRSDDSVAGYQILSRRIDLGELSIDAKGDGSERGARFLLKVSIRGTSEAPYTLGVLNADQSAWVAQTTLPMGLLDEELQFVCGDSGSVYIVIANQGGGATTLDLDEFQVSLEATEDDGLPLSELDEIGWGIGYSLAGEVIEVGVGVDGFKVGDYVSCAGAGQANHAEYVCVKQNLVVKVPQGLPLEHAATATVGSIAMQGVRRADPKLSEVVCLVGLGLIGLMAAQMLRAAGAKVIGLDLDLRRVERALKLGITAAYVDFDECQTAIRHATAGHGADVTVITAAAPSGNHIIINNAMKTTRRRGRVVIVGDVGLHLERSEFYRKEIDLLMSTSYGPGRYDTSYEVFGHDYPYAYVRWTQNRNMAAYLDLIASGEVDVGSLIDLVVPLEAAPEAYASLAAGEQAPMAVVIEYSQPTEATADATSIRIRGARKIRGETLGYALIGAGGFGISMIVPQMDKRTDAFALKAVCSRDPIRGGNFARQRSIATLTTDYDEILADDSIGLVVLATRHDEHASQIVKALAAGKHVFVEKPLALNWLELDQVAAAYAKAQDQVLMIGFNRGFAPAIAVAKEKFGNRRSPMMINYRLNGGFIPGDSWVQDSRGGGRNIGEACHMYDLFASIIDSPVAGITANSIDPSDSALFRNDNFVATITYEDGSVANLIYTALGPKSGMGKERIEIFCEDQSIVVDDFVRCTHFPSESILWEADSADKGHARQFDLLASALVGGDLGGLIPFRRIAETTAVSLHVEDLLQHK